MARNSKPPRWQFETSPFELIGVRSLKDKKILIDLTDHERDRIDTVLNGAKENDDALWMEQLLAPDNIDHSLLYLNAPV